MGYFIKHFIFRLLPMTLAISVVGCGNGASYSSSSKSMHEQDQASVGESIVRGRIDGGFDRNLLGLWNMAPAPVTNTETGRQLAILHFALDFSENNGSPTVTISNYCEVDKGVGLKVKAIAPIVLAADHYEVLSDAHNSISNSDESGEQLACSVNIYRQKLEYQVSGNRLLIRQGTAVDTLTRGRTLH